MSMRYLMTVLVAGLMTATAAAQNLVQPYRGYSPRPAEIQLNATTFATSEAACVHVTSGSTVLRRYLPVKVGGLTGVSLTSATRTRDWVVVARQGAFWLPLRQTTGSIQTAGTAVYIHNTLGFLDSATTGTLFGYLLERCLATTKEHYVPILLK